MEYPLYPIKNCDCPNVAWWEDAVPEETLNELQALASIATNRGVIGGNRIDDEVRRSCVRWLSYRENPNVYIALGEVISELNNRFFRYYLTGFGESMQLTTYSSTDQGTYGWHIDKGGPVSRKLSLVMQLSDPETYEGGELQLNFGGDTPMTIPKKRGLITVFPSWALHRVTPVTLGTRQSLVAWVSGPEFR